MALFGTAAQRSDVCEQAIETCMRLDEITGRMHAQLTTLAGALDADEYTHVTDTYQQALAPAGQVRHAFDGLLRAQPPKAKLAPEAAAAYERALADLATAVTHIEPVAAQIEHWAGLGESLPHLAARLDAQVNLARQSCTAAEQAGRDTAGWRRQINRSVSEQATAAAAARSGRWLAAERALLAQIDVLSAVAAQAQAAPAATTAALAGLADVEESADRVRMLGQDAVARWEELSATEPAAALAPVATHVADGGAKYQQALDLLGAMPRHGQAGSVEDLDRVRRLLSDAEELLTALLTFRPVPDGEAPAPVAAAASGQLRQPSPLREPVVTPTPQVGTGAAEAVHNDTRGQDRPSGSETDAERKLQEILARVQARRTEP